MQKFLKVMKALSDPNRVKILKLLQQRSLCVCELQAVLGIAQPTVSNHLKVLEDAGFVGSRKSGLWADYYLADGNSSPYSVCLLGNLRHWLKDDPQITPLVERLPGIDRETVCRNSPVKANDQKQGRRASALRLQGVILRRRQINAHQSTRTRLQEVS